MKHLKIKTTVKGWKLKDEFLEQCFLRFGSMNKNDYEVELMNLVLQNGYIDATDNSLSRMLQIPISKVKRLRYEVDLRYPKDDAAYRDAFYALLNKSTFKRDGNCIQFSIPNKALREHLSEMLEGEGSYYDSSFNSSIVKMTATDMMLLLSKFENKKELKNYIVKSIENQDKAIPESWARKGITFLKGIANLIVGTAGSQLVSFLTDQLQKNHINN